MTQVQDRAMDLIILIVIIILVITTCSASAYNMKIMIEIEEELPLGQHIATISFPLKVIENMKEKDFENLTFRLLDDKRYKVDLIQVHESTGVVTTKNRLDREAICPENPENCVLLYSFLVTPVFYCIITLEILIKDINDNYPIFPVPTLSLSMLEYLPVGTKFRLPLATDKDSDAFGVDCYAILKKFDKASSNYVAEKFMVEQSGKNLELVVRENLNFSEYPILNPYRTHSFYVVAIDKGNPPLQGVLEIHILGKNDRSPVFSKQSYKGSLSEDAEVGHVVLTVSATDFDMAVNGKVSYELLDIENNLRVPSAEFAIDKDTGLISLKSKVDREEKSSYELLVEARNGGRPPRTATATVSIKVHDVNDNKPIISFIYLVEEGLWENSKPPVPVAFVRVTDPDDFLNGYITCQLTEGSKFFAIQREATTPEHSKNLSFENKLLFFISSTAVLDSESARIINVTVTCRDNLMDGPSHVSSATIPVRVLDINDNEPLFSGSYSMSISENVAAGAIIGRVSASDLDDGLNGRVDYKLLNDSFDYFTINSSTGEIRSKVEFDREDIVPTFELKVVASDGGLGSSKSSTATVYVRILDDNDNLPVFSHSEYNFLVQDSSKPNTMVGAIYASDADEGYNAVIEFRIVRDLKACSEISIDSKTGRLYTNRLANAKRCKVHSFYVEAKNPNLEKSSYVPVKVFVREPTDVEPVFFFPRPEHDLVLLKYPVYVGQEITKLSVVGDMPVIYTLLDTAHISGRFSDILIPERQECLAKTFGLHSENGSVTINLECLDVLKLMKNSTFELTVRAANAKIPVLRSESTLILSFVYLPTLASSGLNNNLIVAIVVPICVLSLFFIIVFVVLWSRRRKSKGSACKTTPPDTTRTLGRKIHRFKQGSRTSNNSLKPPWMASSEDFNLRGIQSTRNCKAGLGKGGPIKSSMNNSLKPPWIASSEDFNLHGIQSTRNCKAGLGKGGPIKSTMNNSLKPPWMASSEDFNLQGVQSARTFRAGLGKRDQMESTMNNSLKPPWMASSEDFNLQGVHCTRTFKAGLGKGGPIKSSTNLSPLKSESVAVEGGAIAPSQDTPVSDQFSQLRIPSHHPDRVLAKKCPTQYAVELHSPRDRAQYHSYFYLVLSPRYILACSSSSSEENLGDLEHQGGTGSRAANSSKI